MRALGPCSLTILSVITVACTGPYSGHEQEILDSPLVFRTISDSGSEYVVMRGQTRDAANRVYCELLLPLGLEDVRVVSAGEYRTYQPPPSCP